ncbi:MAG: efflux RND transporter periplasmic adaptor subunit [Chitinophagaceae bacterium]
MNKILFIILLFTVCSCTSKKEVTQETLPKSGNEMNVTLTDAQIKNAGIVTGKPQMRYMHSLLKVNGLVDVPPRNMLTISFPSGGYLKSTDLLPGMKIRKGQVLAVMQDQSVIQVQEDFLMAQARYTLLEKEYERQKLLNTTKSTSDKIFEQATSEFQSVKISLSSLKQKLLLIGINPASLLESNISRTVDIIAPIDGYVATVRVNIGKYVNPTDVLFELVNTNDLHLALTIFEKDLNSIIPGQLVRCYLTGDTSTIYPAKVMLVSKTLDSNRSATVHCHFTGAVPKLLPGMFMNAEIELTNSSVISVPEEAVVRSGEKDYVFVEFQNKIFQMVPVNTSLPENGFVAISSANLDLLDHVLIIKNSYAALMKIKNTGDEE